MKIICYALLLASVACGQTKMNLLQIIPPPGIGGIGRIDFYDPTYAFATHVTASSTLATNNAFQFPNNTTTTAAVGMCLTLAGTSQGVTTWAACNNTLVPPVSITGSNSSFILSITQSGTGNAVTAAAVNGRAGFFQNTGNTIALEGANTGTSGIGIYGLSNGSGAGIAAESVSTGPGLTATSSSGLAAHFLSGNVVIDNNLTVASCTGCGTTSPPVTFTQSAASTTLTVVNTGSGLALAITTGASTFSDDVNLNGTVAGAHGQNVGVGDNPTWPSVQISGVATTKRPITLETSGSPRWDVFALGPETGSNAGSNFSIGRYDDTGSPIDTPITINRASGLATFADAVTVNGVLTVTSCTGCGTISPPVMLTQSAASTTLTVANSGSGLALNVTTGASSFAGNVNVGGVLTVSSCSGCGTIAPPVLFTQSAASSTLTVANTGSGDALTITTGTSSFGGQVSLNGTVAGAHGQNIGTGDSPTFAGLISTAAVDVDGATGTNRQLYFTTSSSIRWKELVNSAPETGGNAGSNFLLQRFNDAGGLIDSPLSINRASGLPTFSDGVTIDGSVGLTVTGAASSPRNIYLDTSGSSRFLLSIAGTESGSNSGSNFGIARFNDAGSVIDTPMIIERDNALVSFSAGVNVTNTLTANFLIGTSGISAVPVFLNSGGSNRPIEWLTSGVTRWLEGADGSSESGGNAGSNFYIESFSDGGSLLNTVLTINRASGLSTFANDVTITGTTSLNGTVSGTHGQNVGIGDNPTFLGLVSTAAVDIDGAAGTNRQLYFTTGGSSIRWRERVNNAPETGSNAGSNFLLERFSDAGGAIDAPISITRSTGLVTFADDVTITGTATFNGSLSGTHLQNLGTSDSPTFSVLTASAGVSTSGLTITSSGASITGLVSAGASSGSHHVGTTGSSISMTFSDTGGTCRISFSGGGATCPSDERLKKNIAPMESSLDRLMKLRPVDFDWKNTGAPSEGLIAQEVQPIFPLAVSSGDGDAGPDTLHVSYQQLVPYLIKAMQEQQAEISELRSLLKK